MASGPRARTHLTTSVATEAPENSNSRSNRPTGRGPGLSAVSVAAHALTTFGTPEKAEHWMKRPNALFGGRTPAQVMKTDLEGVEAELVRIDHGVYM
jgi:hypothetical protein